MDTRLIPLLALTGLLSLFAGCGKQESPPLPPSREAALPEIELTPFEEQVLFGLKNLRARPAAAAFLAEIGTAPDKDRYLAGTSDPAALARFQEIVRRHAADPAFRLLLEKTCGAGTENPGTEEKAPSDDEGCAPAGTFAGALGTPPPPKKNPFGN